MTILHRKIEVKFAMIMANRPSVFSSRCLIGTNIMKETIFLSLGLSSAARRNACLFTRLEVDVPRIQTLNEAVFKRTVHPQKWFLKYVILRTITKHSAIIINKYTRYHRYRDNNANQRMAAITAAAPEARFEGGKEKTEMLWRHIGAL